MSAPSVTALRLDAEARTMPAGRRDRRAYVASIHPVAPSLPPLGQRFRAAIDPGDLVALKIGGTLSAALIAAVAACQIAPALLDFVRSAF